VSRITDRTPSVTPTQTYSKWGVPPRITTPKATTASGDGHGAGRLGNLEGAGNPGDVDRVGIGPPRHEFLGAAGEQTDADEVVEARDHHAKPQL